MKRLLSYLGIILAAITLIGQTVPVHAATTSSGLSIPPRKNLNVPPGGSVTDKLTITNLDPQKELRLDVKAIDFTFMDESGTPKLFVADNAPQTEWSLKPFVTLPKNIVIPGGKTKTVEYTVKIPKGQGAGSYYSAFRYAASGSEGGQVNLSATGVTLAFVSVPGIVNEDLELKKLGAYQSNDKEADGGSFVFIATNKPDKIGFTLENKGNVAEAPAGSITYKHMFGKAQTIDKVNPLANLALRGQTRLFTTCMKSEDKKILLEGRETVAKNCITPDLIPGRYSINLTAFYGQNGNKTQEIVGSASFWYLPWWFVAIVVAALLFVSYYGWRLYQKVQNLRSGGSGRPKAKRRRR